MGEASSEHGLGAGQVQFTARSAMSFCDAAFSASHVVAIRCHEQELLPWAVSSFQPERAAFNIGVLGGAQMLGGFTLGKSDLTDDLHKPAASGSSWAKEALISLRAPPHCIGANHPRAPLGNLRLELLPRCKQCQGLRLCRLVNGHDDLLAPARLGGCAMGIEAACLPQGADKHRGFVGNVFTDHHIRNLACRG